MRNFRPASLGWTIGRNVQIDTRWATANAADYGSWAFSLQRSCYPS
jgi:hypothetical protein